MSGFGSSVYGRDQGDFKYLKGKHSDDDTEEQLESAVLRISELEHELEDSENHLRDALGPIEDEAIDINAEDFDPAMLDRSRAAKAAQEITLLRQQNEALRTHVDDLENQVRKLNSAISAEDACLEIASLRGELEDAKDRLASYKETDKDGTNDASGVSALRTQLEDTKAQLETHKTAEAALRQQLGKTGAKDMADGVYIDALKSQIKDLTAAQSHMQITANHLKKGMEKAKQKQDRTGFKLRARDAYVLQLTSRSEREKEARFVTIPECWIAASIC